MIGNSSERPDSGMIERGLFAKAAEQLHAWQRILILTHDRPDGDALGASAAMKALLESTGRQATILLAEPCPARYGFMAEKCHFKTSWPDDLEGFCTQFDGILILDTCSRSQLLPFADLLTGCPLPRIILDHHTTRDDLSDAGSEALYLIDPQAASACSVLYRWCMAAGWTIDASAAEALFVGLVTDTGWFRFPNAGPETFRIAGELVRHGARTHVIYNALYERWSASRLRLQAEALSTLTFHARDRLAVMHIDPAMFERAGASPQPTEELVNQAMMVGSVLVSILLVAEGEDTIRTSFRSKSPELGTADVNVAALAAQFGGGGHRRAAGARIRGDLETARRGVIEAAIHAMDVPGQD
jgi:phosphoesterase RecJ-like protein